MVIIEKQLENYCEKVKFMGNLEKKIIGRLYIKETKNNIFVNLSDLTGKIIVTYSAGNIGMHGSNRRTAFAGKFLGKKLGKEALFRNIHTVRLSICGPVNHIVKSVVQGILSYRVDIIEVEQLKGRAHNGVRKRKQRRL